MKLHDNQLHLIQHLARFNLLDYADCLKMLDVDGTGDRTALSYVFRPLTKNKYLSKRKDGSVSILSKGRALFPEVKPLIAAGGADGEERGSICREYTGVARAVFYPLRLLAEHRFRHPVHHPLHRDTGSGGAPSGSL